MTQIHSGQSFSRDQSFQPQETFKIKQFMTLGISISNDLTTFGTPKINFETQESQDCISYSQELAHIQRLKCDKKYQIELLRSFKKKIQNEIQIMKTQNLHVGQINTQKGEEMVSRGHQYFQQYIKKFRNQSEYFKKMMKDVQQDKEIQNALHNDDEMKEIFNALNSPLRKKKIYENEKFLKDLFFEFRKANNKMLSHIQQAQQLTKYYDELKELTLEQIIENECKIQLTNS